MNIKKGRGENVAFYHVFEGNTMINAIEIEAIFYNFIVRDDSSKHPRSAEFMITLAVPISAKAISRVLLVL